MDTLRLSNKGQILIPKEIRARHHWGPGTELVIEDRGDVLVLRAAKPFPPTRLEDGLGRAGYRDLPSRPRRWIRRSVTPFAVSGAGEVRDDRGRYQRTGTLSDQR